MVTLPIRSGVEAVVRWVWLVYRLPRQPSSPRIAVWRGLRRLGVAQVADGVAALPLDARTREQLEWIADEVVEAGGEASVWVVEPTSQATGRRLAEAMAAERAEEYRELIGEAHAAIDEDGATRRRVVRRLRRQLRRIRRRDYFPPVERDQAEAAVQTLVARLEEGQSVGGA